MVNFAMVSIMIPSVNIKIKQRGYKTNCIYQEKSTREEEERCGEKRGGLRSQAGGRRRAWPRIVSKVSVCICEGPFHFISHLLVVALNT